MLKIGLTGGVGSGKTAVSDAFSALGVTIIDTDIIARDVLIDNQTLLDTLTQAFGKQILDQNQQLIRPKLREVAFQTPENKKKLDNIMHPVIRQETLHQIKLAEKKENKYCIVVVPLLIETGFKKLVDRVLVVTAPHNRKLNWLKKRSELDQVTAEKIMSSQSSDAEKLAIANEHIHNDLDLDNITARVKALHTYYSSITN